MNVQQAMTQMREALDHLCKMFPGADNTVAFELSDYGDNGIRCPSFYASTNAGFGCSESKTPMKAVKSLLALNRITTVEQYIRIKEAQS